MFYGDNSKDTAFKFIKKRGRYEASNVTFDPKTMQAYSYDWWLFLTVIKGKVIFNNYSYSNSTGGHQSKVRRILKELNIKIDLEVSVREGLQDLNSGLKSEYYRMFQLEIELKRKGVKNIEQRQDGIEECLEKIKALREIGCTFSRTDQKLLKLQLANEEQKRLERAREERQNVDGKPLRSNDSFVRSASSFEIV